MKRAVSRSKKATKQVVSASSFPFLYFVGFEGQE